MPIEAAPRSCHGEEACFKARRGWASDQGAPELGVPKMLSWLDKTARAEWRRVVPQLAELGVLTRVYGAALEAYCSTYSKAVAFQQLADASPMVEGQHGLKINPAVSEARKQWALVCLFASEFGLTPSGRTRVGAPVTKKADDDAELEMFGTA